MSVNKHSVFPDDYSPPKWLPFWVNIEEYLAPEFLGDDEVRRHYAWQFLRRSPKYQQRYAEMLDLAISVDNALGYTRRSGYNKSIGINSYVEGKTNISFENLLNDTCKEFLLTTFMPNPSNGNYTLPALSLGNNIRRPPITWEGDLEEYERLIFIDLRYPLQPQLDRAHSILKIDQVNVAGKELSPTEKKRHIETLVRYLRILDADMVRSPRVTDTEIRKTMYASKNLLCYTKDEHGRSKNPRNPAAESLKADRKAAYDLLLDGWRFLLS